MTETVRRRLPGCSKTLSLEREKVLQAAQKYVEKKKYDRAIAEYQKIIQEDPNDARTLLKIGDLQASLHFTWSDDGKLTEISLQTDPLSAISYEDSLKLCWDDLILLLSDLHGAPVQSAPYPPRADVPQDSIIGSHIWKLEKGGTAMLGTAKISDKYIVVVRFSEKTVEEIQKSQKGAE